MFQRKKMFWQVKITCMAIVLDRSGTLQLFPKEWDSCQKQPCEKWPLRTQVAGHTYTNKIIAHNHTRFAKFYKMGCLGGIKTEFQYLNRMSCQDKGTLEIWSLLAQCFMACAPPPWEQCWAWRESLRPLVSRMAPQVNSVPAENTILYRDGHSLPLTRARLIWRHPPNSGSETLEDWDLWTRYWGQPDLGRTNTPTVLQSCKPHSMAFSPLERVLKINPQYDRQDVTTDTVYGRGQGWDVV